MDERNHMSTLYKAGKIGERILVCHQCMIATVLTLVRELNKLGDIVKWPLKKNKPRSNPYSKLWCDFRGDYRHMAYDCVTISREIQTLVKIEYLTEYMAGHKERGNTTPPRQPPPPPHHKVINFIASGSEMCGMTYSQEKRIAREPKTRLLHADIAKVKSPIIQFDETKMEYVTEPQHDSLVISFPVGNCLIRRILIDNGSAIKIIMLETLGHMGWREADMVKKSTVLVGFSGETKRTIGAISLPTYAQGMNYIQKFLLIHCQSTYNIILQRPWIHDLEAVSSMYHQVVKFPTPWGIQQIHGDRILVRECYKNCLKPTVQYKGVNVPQVVNTELEKLTKISLTLRDKKVLVGQEVPPEIKPNLFDFLMDRLDAFAWEHEDIIRISQDVVTHKLNVNPS